MTEQDITTVTNAEEARAYFSNLVTQVGTKESALNAEGQVIGAQRSRIEALAKQHLRTALEGQSPGIRSHFDNVLSNALHL